MSSLQGSLLRRVYAVQCEKEMQAGLVAGLEGLSVECQQQQQQAGQDRVAALATALSDIRVTPQPSMEVSSRYQVLVIQTGVQVGGNPHYTEYLVERGRVEAGNHPVQPPVYPTHPNHHADPPVQHTGPQFLSSLASHVLHNGHQFRANQ